MLDNSSILRIKESPGFNFSLQVKDAPLLLMLIFKASFELIEYNLDHLIEFLFHTNVHNTQVIVFYIILVLGLLGLYAFTRVAASFCIKQWHNYRIFMHRKKSSFLYCWRGKPLIHKIGIISAVIIASACYVMYGGVYLAFYYVVHRYLFWKICIQAKVE
jgi:hypothetical protein